MTLVVAAPAIAIGSGRAAIWAALAPAVVRDGVGAALSVLGWFLAASALAFVAALLAGAGEAATMMSQLHLSAATRSSTPSSTSASRPTPSLFSGSFLLGPGFAVGGGTMVSPGLVVLGPLPLLPLLAALPGAGATAGWVASLVAVPPSSPPSPRRGGSTAVRRCAGTTGRCAGAAAASWPASPSPRSPRWPGGRGTGPDAARRPLRPGRARARDHRLRRRRPGRRSGHDVVAAPRRRALDSAG